MSKDIDYDLIINDGDCQAIAREYCEIGERFEEYLNSYSEILNTGPMSIK